MATIPKQPSTRPRKGKQSPQPAPSAPTITDTSGLEYGLEQLASAVGRYVDRAASSDNGNSLQLYTGPEGSGYHPVLLAFQGETTDRIATALERIADAMMAGKGDAAK